MRGHRYRQPLPGGKSLGFAAQDQTGARKAYLSGRTVKGGLDRPGARQQNTAEQRSRRVAGNRPGSAVLSTRPARRFHTAPNLAADPEVSNVSGKKNSVPPFESTNCPRRGARPSAALVLLGPASHIVRAPLSNWLPVRGSGCPSARPGSHAGFNTSARSLATAVPQLKLSVAKLPKRVKQYPQRPLRPLVTQKCAIRRSFVYSYRPRTFRPKAQIPSAGTQREPFCLQR